MNSVLNVGNTQMNKAGLWGTSVTGQRGDPPSKRQTGRTQHSHTPRNTHCSKPSEF